MSGARAGRPPGTSDAVRQREDELLDLRESGLSVEEIIIRTGGSASHVNQMIRNARSRRTNPEAARPLAILDPDAPPKSTRRMSQGTVLRRAWLAMHLDGRLRRVDGGTRMFWLEVVMAIHEIGDGRTLQFAETGFQDRADFAASYDGADDMLALLVRRRVLLEPENGTIGLPPAMGLTQRERPGGKLLADAVRGRLHSDRRQGEILMAGGGERPESGEIIGFESGRIHSESGEMHDFESGRIRPDSGEKPRPESGEIRRAGGEKGTTTTTKERDSLFGGGGLVAGSAGEASHFPGLESGEMSGNMSGETSPHVGLAVELAEIVGRPAQVSPVELELVRTWLTDGATPDLIRDAIRSRMARKGAPEMPALGYFNDRVREHMAKTPPAVREASKPPPLSAEDAAAVALIKPASDAWAADRSCPFPPTVASFKAAIAAGHESLAHRWVTVSAAWHAAGRPGAGKPPDFTRLSTRPAEFEADLDRAEEELTNPEPPFAAG